MKKKIKNNKLTSSEGHPDQQHGNKGTAENERFEEGVKGLDEIEEYILNFPGEVQEILRKIRKLIKDNAPGAQETMAYGMPAYKTNRRPLVYFAAFKNHIGFYATPSGHSEFKAELSKYKQGKGSVQFPLDKPIPYELIERIVIFRVEESKIKKKK